MTDGRPRPGFAWFEDGTARAANLEPDTPQDTGQCLGKERQAKRVNAVIMSSRAAGTGRGGQARIDDIQVLGARPPHCERGGGGVFRGIGSPAGPAFTIGAGIAITSRAYPGPTDRDR